jgi:hypothetical protein
MNTYRLLSTLLDIAKLEVYKVEELEKDVKHIATLKNIKSVELYY